MGKPSLLVRANRLFPLAKTKFYAKSSVNSGNVRKTSPPTQRNASSIPKKKSCQDPNVLQLRISIEIIPLPQHAPPFLPRPHNPRAKAGTPFRYVIPPTLMFRPFEFSLRRLEVTGLEARYIIRSQSCLRKPGVCGFEGFGSIRWRGRDEEARYWCDEVWRYSGAERWGRCWREGG